MSLGPPQVSEQDQGPAGARPGAPRAPLVELSWLAGTAVATALVWWLANLGPTWRLTAAPLDLLLALPVLLIVHELLHVVMARLAGVAATDIGLSVGPTLLRVTVTQRLGPRAWAACTLAPCLILSVLLLVPLLRSGDPFWLVLLAVHLASCRSDWGLALRGPGGPSGLPDRLLPAGVTLGLMVVLGLLLPRLPASLWLRADQVVWVASARPHPPSGGSGEQVVWRFRARDARALVLTWTVRRGSRIESATSLDLPLSRDHGDLTVRLDPEAGGGATLSAHVDGGPPRTTPLPGNQDLPGGSSLLSLAPAALSADRERLLLTRLANGVEIPPDADALADCATLSIGLGGEP